MKLFFVVLGALLFLPLSPELSAKTLTVKVQKPDVTVTRLPMFGPQQLRYGPQFFAWRCTNHTTAAQMLEIELMPTYSQRGLDLKIRSYLTLPPLASREISILAPRVSGQYHHLTYTVSSLNGALVRHHSGRVNRGKDGMVSSSFKPDMIEYLFGDLEISPLPVKEWPRDTRAYAGLRAIVLDSADHLDPDLLQALRLAAARGTRILVLVMGQNEWPAYAGKETPGKVFEEKIGFGTWTVMRSQALDSNAAWKAFVRKKHAAAPNGKWSGKYKSIRWHENLERYLNNKFDPDALAKQNRLPHPPIPMGMLTLTMIVFVIIIGPVNYIFLKKRRAEIWSLATIPGLSLLFTGAVIVTVFLGEGITSSGKGNVETRLDQTTGLAASRGGFGIYSPLSAGSFKFTSGDILCFYDPGRINGVAEGGTCVYANTLVRSRMGFCYSVSSAEFRSEKIAVTEKGSSIEIVNGLGVKVDFLYLRSKGRLFKLSAPLAPGARAMLEPAVKLPAAFEMFPENHYRARLSEPLFVKPGFTPDKYEHTQNLLGRWR